MLRYIYLNHYFNHFLKIYLKKKHFACAQCEIPFNGSRHFEKRGLAYCETHYKKLFGEKCFNCNEIITGDGKLNF